MGGVLSSYTHSQKLKSPCKVPPHFHQLSDCHVSVEIEQVTWGVSFPDMGTGDTQMPRLGGSTGHAPSAAGMERNEC